MQNPTQGLQNLITNPSFKKACCGYFMAALSLVLFFNIGDELTIPVLLLKVLILFVAELTLGTLIASFSGFFLTFRKKNISPAQLFVLIGSAGFIKGLLIAFALISAACPAAGLGVLAPLALLLVLALQLTYLTCSLCRVTKTSVSLALLAWFFGIIPVAAMFALLGVFLIWMIILVA